MTSPFRTVLDEHDGEKVRNQIRWRKTLEFLNEGKAVVIREGGETGLGYKCLDIGDRSILTGMMEERFRYSFQNTFHDLDVVMLWPDTGYDDARFNIVTCFEVIEHLFNPLHCLLQIKKLLMPGGRIYLSTPRRKPISMWDPHHFHEMTDRSLFALIERAGLAVVRRKKIFIAPWRGLLTGFRPWLRLFVDRVWLLELEEK